MIVRDAAGRPTGLVQETAQQLIQELILPYSIEAIEAALDRATSYYAAEGITSFTEAGIGGGWIGHSPVELAAYQRAASAGRLHARAQLMPVLDVLHPLGGQNPPDAAAGRPGPGHRQRLRRRIPVAGPGEGVPGRLAAGRNGCGQPGLLQPRRTRTTPATPAISRPNRRSSGRRSRPPTRRAGPSLPTPSVTAPSISRSTSSPTAPRNTGRGPCPTGSNTPR